MPVIYLSVPRLQIKQYILLFLFLLWLVYPVNCSAATGNEVALKFNGEELQTEQPLILVEGETLAPLKFFSEQVGAETSWKEDSQELILLYAGSRAEFQLGNQRFLREGKEFLLDTPPQKIDGEVYLPLRPVAELLNLRLDWQGDENLLVVQQVATELREIIFQDEGQLRFTLTDEAEMETSTLKKPPRLVVDIYGTQIGAEFSGIEQQERENSPIQNVRIAEHEPGVLRVVADLDELVPYEKESTERSGSGKTEHRINFHNLLHDIEIRENEKERANIELKTAFAPEYTVRQKSSPERIEVELQNAALPEEELERYQTDHLDSKALKQVRTETKENSPTLKIAFLQPYYGEYAYTSSEQGLIVELHALHLKDKTVILDPGHGGSDPGAIGPSGLKEKNVALKLARLLMPYLEAAGAEVHLTRDEDYYLALEKRAKLANKNGGDLFLSIHHNACTHNQKRGVETLFFPGSIYGEKLARAINEGLVEATGLDDLGFRSEKLLLLQKTQMPAVLTEVGYITHPREEKLLREMDFLNAAAQGILEGLLELYNPERG